MQAASLLARSIKAAIQTALKEDLPSGDITTQLLFPNLFHTRAHVVAHEPMIVAGLAVAIEVFKKIDSSLKVQNACQDGDRVGANTILFSIEGDARSILTGERVALNFLQHLSGIATLTARFCQAVKGYSTKILDTRKTIPGLRVLQKWAVRLGGGTNHRFSLSDGILIKDNHLALLRSQGVGLDEACHLARKHRMRHLKVIVEADTLPQVRKAMKSRPDVVLLDNMVPKKVAQAVAFIRGRALTEVSGGVTLGNVGQMAAAGADFISVGALTHSAPAMNISLKIPRPVKYKRGLHK